MFLPAATGNGAASNTGPVSGSSSTGGIVGGAGIESKVALTVEVGGSVTTAGTAGSFVTAPGRQILITASEPVQWTGASTGEVVKRTEISTSTTQWISKLANTDHAQNGAYTLTVVTADGLSKTLRFVVQPGDARNGDYKVFAVSGARLAMAVDFDLGSYDMTDLSGTKSSGSLSPPPSPGGSYSVSNPRITTPVNVSSLRAFGDTIVGAFPFQVAFSSPVSYAAAPFIATRAQVSVPADINGVYNRLRVDRNATASDSFISQMRLSGGGTVLTECADNQIFRIDLCPVPSTVVHDVALDAEPGLWAILDPVSHARTGRFSIARVNGENVYLSAGDTTVNSIPTVIFSIGLPEVATWTTFNSSGGWSNQSSVDIASATATTSFLSYTDSTGATSLLRNFTLGGIVNGPTGMRSAVDGADAYFTIRSSKLEVLAGSRNPATRGYMHLGVIN